MGLVERLFSTPSEHAHRLVLDAHHEILRTNLRSSPLACVGVLAALYGRTSTLRLVAAGALMVLVCGLLVRIGLPRAESGPARDRERAYGAINVIGGLAMGAYFALAFPVDAQPQSWLAMAIPLVMVVNMVEAAPVPRSFVGFHVPFTVAVCGLWASSGAGANRWAAVVFLVIAGYVVSVARALHAEALERAELAVRNGTLVAELEAANADLAATNADLELESHHDRLTGVPNRRALDRHLAEVFAPVPASGPDGCVVDLRGQIAALFIDLDGFKAVNDAHGHGIGDDVLAMTARRLEHCVGDLGFLARFGGDEFVVVLSAVESIAPSLDLAEAIVAAVREPYVVDGVAPIRIGASVGVAVSPSGRGTGRELLHEADTGMYRAKQAGRGRWARAS